MTPSTPDPVEHPQFTLGGKEYTLRIEPSHLLKLHRKHGINLLEQPPDDPAAKRKATLERELRETPEDSPNRESLQAKIAEADSQISVEFREWQPSWGKGNLLDQMDTATRIIEVCCGVEDAAERMQMEDIQGVLAAAGQAVGKVWARMIPAAK